MTMKVHGLRELEKALVELGSRAGKQALLGALRDAAKPIRKAARRNAPKKSGLLRKSIKTKAAATKGGGDSAAKVQIGVFRDGKKSPFYAVMIEKGAKKHRIPSSSKGRGKNKTKNNVRLAFGGRVVSSVNHPGVRARPFMKPAFEQNHKEALKILKRRLKERIILQAVKRYGRKIP